MFNQAEWDAAVEEGARAQTLRRLHSHSEKATAYKKARLADEFEKAWAHRMARAREANKNKTYDRFLTLEQYARLWVINLESWAAFVVWRDLRGKRIFFVEEGNGQASPAASAL